MADLPCPTCGSPLAFLDQYHRYYCHRCGQYAPEGYGDRGAQRCPTCGGILSYISQYDRFYCYRCNAYPPPETATPPATTAPTETLAAAPAQPAVPAVATPSSTAITPAPTPAEAALVAAATPVPLPASPQPSSEPTPTPTAAPETPQPATGTTPSPALTVAPAEKPPEPAPAEPSREMLALAASKPAVVRVKIFALKKSELIDLTQAYHLDPSGTKEQLQERLLSYLHDLETEEQPETEPEEEPEPHAEPEAEPVAAAAPVKQEGMVKPAEVTAVPVATSAAAVLVEEPQPRPAPASQAAPAVVPVAVTPQAAGAAETPRPVSRAEHPCPTCGRELTYISQYNRWYCYYCQRYAPAAPRSKNACPTCGATMRWIEPHRRWWCDSCQKYASADLPAPGGEASVAATPAPVAAAAPVRTVPAHRHGSPASGAGLVGLGLALYIVYAFFAFLGDLLGFAIPTGITPELLDILQLFAFLLVAAGAIVGLYGLRDRT